MSMSTRAVAISFSLVVLSACTPKTESKNPPTDRAGSFVVENDGQGSKVLFRVVNGRVDRSRPIPTDPRNWTPNNFQRVNCYTFRATQGNAEVCGVACTDGKIYKMGCGADIFDSGYDKLIQE